MRFILTGRQLLYYGLVIAFSAAVLGSVSLTYPFGRDQAIYAYAGKLILMGKMNYLYTFDLKPPGIHFLFAFIQLVFGESMLNARIFDIIWQFATAFLLFILSAKLSANKIISLIISILYIFLYYRLDYWHTLQTDGALNLFFTLSVLLLIMNDERHSFAGIFISGITFGLALLIKYTIVSFIPLIIIALLCQKRFLFTLRLKNSAMYLTGVLLIGIITLLLYSFTGALNAFWDIQFVQTPLYTKIAYETETSGYIYAQILKLFFYSVYSPFIWLSIISLVIAIVKKQFNFQKLIIFAWAFSALFSLFIQWKFYYYHFLVIIPPILVGSVLSAESIKNLFKTKKKVLSFGAALFITGILIFGFNPYKTGFGSVYRFIANTNSLENEYKINGFTTESVFMYSKTIKAVDIIKKNTKLSDNVYIWGFDPLIYYLSGRNCTSRFIYNFPLLWKGENSAFRNEFIKNVEEKYPEMIIVAKNDPMLFISGYNEDSAELLHRFPEFDQIMKEKYTFFSSADDYEIFKLKSW